MISADAFVHQQRVKGAGEVFEDGGLLVIRLEEAVGVRAEFLEFASEDH